MVLSGPDALDIGNNEKGNNGIGEKINRSEDEVFSDAVADFSDSGLSQGVKEHLQEGSLDSDSGVERVEKGDPKFPGSSEENSFNGKKISYILLVLLYLLSIDLCKVKYSCLRN